MKRASRPKDFVFPKPHIRATHVHEKPVPPPLPQQQQQLLLYHLVGLHATPHTDFDSSTTPRLWVSEQPRQLESKPSDIN